MPFSRSETQTYTRSFYRFLDLDCTFTFKRMKKYAGTIDGWDRKSKVIITLDPKKNVISTMMHEFLHYRHPNMCESNIAKLEKKLMNSLSDRQVKNILKRVANYL